MSDWMREKDDEIVIFDRKKPINRICEYNISDEGISVLENWNKLNQTNFTIEQLFSLLQLGRVDFIDIKFVDYPIHDDMWKNPDYVGSFRFDICISRKNSFNEFFKCFIDEFGENNRIRHIIHLYKGCIVLDMDYMNKVKDFRKFEIVYKIDKSNQNYNLVKTHENSLIILEPKSMYESITDTVICKRFKDIDEYYVLNICKHLHGENYTQTIKFKLKNNVEFNFPNEIELMEKISDVCVSFPEYIIDIMKNYFNKYNLDVEYIKIEGINNEKNF